GKNLAFRARHFQNTPEGFALSPAIKDCVHFFQGNILNNDFLPGLSAYDFIFCRNLLIYFDRPTQQKALSRIDRWLATTGGVFVGPADFRLVLEQGYASANIPMAFACRKTSNLALVQVARPEAKARPTHRNAPHKSPPVKPLPYKPGVPESNGHLAKPVPAVN